MRDVAIIGAGMTDFGKFLDRGMKDLAREAVQGALDSAGLDKSKLEAAVVGNATAGLITGQEMIRGQVVYVNFWATWCLPCLLEMPHIAALQEEFGDELAIITVNRRESLDAAETYFENLPLLDGGTGVSFTVDGMDPDDTLYDLYRAIAMPTSFFVDADGVISIVGHGLISLDQMRSAVDGAIQGA